MAIEKEKRYLVNPNHCPPLSDIDFWIYHQAELGSGKAGIVIPEFLGKVGHLLTSKEISQFNAITSGIQYEEKVKIRTRDILRFGESPRAELTVKKKYPEINGYKHYDEDNIKIRSSVAKQIIELIAPPILFSGNVEYGVYKHRHNPTMNGQILDLDVLRRANTGPITLEIETDDSDKIIIPPPYVVCQINGRNEFKMLGTGELQRRPWACLTENEKRPYFDALKGKYKNP